ncbi:Auxin response factor 3 [Striga hermonthica]|uniref:Auxin response factor n=1 Tax=Striga hermonthica TaxID=68872 RepID=A0A9N7MRI1_STRHE|nr:Auxin response factor 3 [Striga hermonthica]
MLGLRAHELGASPLWLDCKVSCQRLDSSSQSAKLSREMLVVVDTKLETITGCSKMDDHGKCWAMPHVLWTQTRLFLMDYANAEELVNFIKGSNMLCGLIDLNAASNEDETASSSGSPSLSAVSGSLDLSATSPAAAAAVCMELWHACAGPLISLPKKGSAVIEQNWREGITRGEAGDDDVDGVVKSLTPHMFCKTLTASDTSTHGGFSVPRRAAEDCFPPLDYKQQRPSQELVAKDLHGTEWKFRHIYRGQPRRHLLTTGWSAFVNKKKLVSGDAVLFLRGGDGELRLGIRRAMQVKTSATVLPPNSEQFKASSLVSVVSAITMGSTFDICYNPRARSSEIIVPYHKFSKSLSQPFSCGMRFKVRFETEDTSDRRCGGLIVGVSDADPKRWPGSKWKCLLVRWDDMEVNRLNRVSPWDIELSGSVSGPNSFVLPGTKRNRVGFPTAKPDLPLPGDGSEVSEFGEPLRFQKVLQGQEVFAFGQHTPDVMMRCYPRPNGSRFRAGGANTSITQYPADAQNSSFGQQSFQFHQKVLQGQEIGPRLGNSWPALNQAQAQARAHSANMQPFVPPQFTSLHKSSRAINHDPFSVSHRILNKFGNGSVREDLLGPEVRGQTGFTHHRPVSTRPFFGENPNFVSMCKDSCRLFGFPLTEGKVLEGKRENPTGSSPSAYGHESNTFPCNEEQAYHHQPSLVAKVIASSCTKVHDMHSVRDRLLDIAL